MSNRRIERLNEQLKRELTGVVRQDVRDPRVGPVTITEVRATPDLDHARVFITAIGTDDEKQASLAGLRAAAPFIRTELSRRLHIRRVPELTFVWDETLERAQRIEELLREVRPTDTDPGPAGDVEDGGA